MAVRPILLYGDPRLAAFIRCGIGARFAVQEIVSGAADQQVAAFARVEFIVTGAAQQDVAAVVRSGVRTTVTVAVAASIRTTLEVVVAGTAVQQVVASAA